MISLPDCLTLQEYLSEGYNISVEVTSEGQILVIIVFPTNFSLYTHLLWMGNSINE
jgi:hypothetical protein